MDSTITPHRWYLGPDPLHDPQDGKTWRLVWALGSMVQFSDGTSCKKSALSGKWRKVVLPVQEYDAPDAYEHMAEELNNFAAKPDQNGPQMEDLFRIIGLKPSDVF